MIVDISKYYLLDKSKYYIYKITSPSNKIYIGQSTSIKTRFKSYKNLHCKGQSLLYKSFVKYRVTNHIFEILEIFNNDIDISILNDKEIFYIKYYKINSYKMLNLTEGGRNALKSESTKKKLSESAKRRYRNEKNPMYGKHHTEETKLKISKINKGRKLTEKNKAKLIAVISKPVLQYDLNGNFIKEWSSSREVDKELGFNSRVINSQARGLRKSAYSFIWKYKNI